MRSIWTIKWKLMASFLLVSAITATLGGVGYYAVQSGSKAIDEVGVVRLPSVDSLLTIAGAAQNCRGTTRTLAIPGIAPEVRQRQYDNLAKARERYEAAWKIYESLPQTVEAAQLWKQFVPAWGAWREENNKYMDVCRQLDKENVSDPVGLARHLEVFVGDHQKLAKNVLYMLQTKKPFDGGEDHTACRCGKWMSTYKADNSTLAQELQGIAPPHEHFHEAVKQIKQLVADGKTDEALALYEQEMEPAAQQVFGHFDAMLKTADDFHALSMQNTERLFGVVRDKDTIANDILDKIVQINRDVAAAAVKDSGKKAAMFQSTSLAAAIFGVVTALGLGSLITWGINRKLTRVTIQLNEGGNQLNDAASQVSMAAQQLAESNSEQASSLEETSSTLEQMASMTRANADNAAEANQLANQAHAAANQGEQTMSGINAASDKISKIIKVIEEIAFQTNLLALNAAVEAARAGEHGKGFAVVAEEVRNLAERFAGTAHDTTTLIEESVAKSRDGVLAIKSIVEGVAKVTTLIEGIARASQEQAQGVEQVNVAVSQMDQVTQQNAAGAEESASAAEELSAQAESVKGTVAELVAMVGGGSRYAGRGPGSGLQGASVGAPTPRKHFEPKGAPPSKTKSRQRAGRSGSSNASTSECKVVAAEDAAVNDF